VSTIKAIMKSALPRAVTDAAWGYNQTPVAEGIGIGADTRFTDKINTVTLEVRK
jgi:hypothetical protein